MFPPVTSKWRLVAVLLALSIGAAACGSTETSSAPTLAPQATSAAADQGSPDDSVSGDDASGDEAAPESDAQEETAGPAVNLFPDIDVLNIADGATVNLAAELGGADKATLLWFFAPH